MKKLFLLLIFCPLQIFAQQLSPQAQVSLLTISPGEELYSTFGHSAIRISDPAQFIDVNYNYGTFDFNSSGFYIKFLRGYLDYLLSSHNSYVEMEYWNRSNRKITEQVLLLSQEQKQRLFNYLENNLLPENRNYRYKFFTDNCSTRLRDVLMQVCGDSLVFDQQLNADSTYRQWIDKYAHENGKAWADFGMDLAIGRGADKKTGWADAMFIPDNLMKAFDEAKVRTPEGWKNLVVQKHDLNRIQPRNATSGILPSFFFLFFMGLILVYTIWQYLMKKQSIALDKVLFTITGLAGWVLVFLWWGTDHGVTRYNLNLLWASPLVFPTIFFVTRRRWANAIFLLFAFAMVVGWLAFMQSGKSTFSAAVVCIILTLAIRIIFIMYQIQRSRYAGIKKFDGRNGPSGG